MPAKCRHPRNEVSFRIRDPKRITAVLEQIERIWRVYPDWRLGQLICNLAAWADPTQNVVWDIEDKALVAEVERHLNQQGQPVGTD